MLKKVKKVLQTKPKPETNILHQLFSIGITLDEYNNELDIIKNLLSQIPLTNEDEKSINIATLESIKHIAKSKTSYIEKLLKRYSLSSAEGRALIELTEALLRIPDRQTVYALIEDKINNKTWIQNTLKDEKYSDFLGKAAAYGLTVLSKSMKTDSSNGRVKGVLSNVTAPVASQFIKATIKHLSDGFIIGENVKQAIKRAEKYMQKGFTFSYDILGESARSYEQAEEYITKYKQAIPIIGESALYAKQQGHKVLPSISVKLSALHPRFELRKQPILEKELIPVIKELVMLANEHNIDITFDAEEIWRADIYLIILEKIISDPELKDCHNIGLVQQAYAKRTNYILDSIASIAKKTKKRIPVRLVKGAYWDTEIKHAQALGLKSYPVFTKKVFTDLSYIACAQKMLEHYEYILPQFATHNAQTIATISRIFKDKTFELQKLFGMGDSLYEFLLNKNSKNNHISYRIYAPIGEYKDLLAYLMRRMLENGANSSFVNQVLAIGNGRTQGEEKIQKLAMSSVVAAKELLTSKSLKMLPLPDHIFTNRLNSRGYELGSYYEFKTLSSNIMKFENSQYNAYSIIAGREQKGDDKKLLSPLDNQTTIGHYHQLVAEDYQKVIATAEEGFEIWSSVEVSERAAILNRIAELYEENQYELYRLLIEEAGKNIDDAIAEVREAIDMIRYYALQAEELMREKDRPKQQGYTGESNILIYKPKGLFVCISPWNFPLAIFTGQIIAALATGNAVIAKPAANTSLIASFAVNLILEAGVETKALSLVVGKGSDVTNHLISDPRVAGVCFTGSTATANIINKTLAHRDSAIATLIAETGGKNAMIIDSSALLEQCVDDAIQSAFGSMGQRCSALRVLYVQEEIYDNFLSLLKDAMKTRLIGDTREFIHDFGSIIDQDALKNIRNHINKMKSLGFDVYSCDLQWESLESLSGNYIAPHVIAINNILDMPEEIFGPVLHVVKYSYGKIDEVISEINNTGYGLTFGIHTRIANRYKYITSRIRAGNIYINRNMIGAMVESQPFGGEGLSGTGLKAGGPNYLLRFVTERLICNNVTALGGNIELIASDD